MPLTAGHVRLGVVLDAALEGWTSMDYVGEMVVETLRREHGIDASVSPLKPWLPERLSVRTGNSRRFSSEHRAARRSVPRLSDRDRPQPLSL